MKISEETLKLLKEQVAIENNTSQAYLLLASQATQQDFLGFGKWLRKRSNEELVHRDKIIEFLEDLADGIINVNFTDNQIQVDQHFGVKDILAKVLELEEANTEKINNIYCSCFENDDDNVAVWIQWFINEQTEEIASVKDYISKANIAMDMLVFDNWIAEQA
jgi:ferritin